MSGSICFSILTHLPLVPHIYVSESGQHWFRFWPVTYSVPSHYLNQYSDNVNWSLRNKLQWNFNQNTKLFIDENASENIVCEMAAILSRGDELKTDLHGYVSHQCQWVDMWPQKLQFLCMNSVYNWLPVFRYSILHVLCWESAWKIWLTDESRSFISIYVFHAEEFLGPAWPLKIRCWIGPLGPLYQMRLGHG